MPCGTISDISDNTTTHLLSVDVPGLSRACAPFAPSFSLCPFVLIISMASILPGAATGLEFEHTPPIEFCKMLQEKYCLECCPTAKITNTLRLQTRVTRRDGVEEVLVLFSHC